MSELKEQLLAVIMKEVESTDDDSFDVFEESIEQFQEQYGNENILTESLDILKEESNSKCWYLTASIISWIVEDSEDLQVDGVDTVATLYICLERLPDLGVSGPADGSNLVWSISHSIKNVDYLDDWNPLEDEVILTRMAKIKHELSLK